MTLRERMERRLYGDKQWNPNQCAWACPDFHHEQCDWPAGHGPENLYCVQHGVKLILLKRTMDEAGIESLSELRSKP